jgi:hypothetical protein
MLCAKLDTLPNSRKDSRFAYTASVTFIYGGSQGGEFSLKLLFFPLKTAECGTNYLAGIFVAAAFYFRKHKPFQLIRQVHVSRWHISPSDINVALLAIFANSRRAPTARQHE